MRADFGAGVEGARVAAARSEGADTVEEPQAVANSTTASTTATLIATCIRRPLPTASQVAAGEADRCKDRDDQEVRDSPEAERRASRVTAAEGAELEQEAR